MTIDEMERAIERFEAYDPAVSPRSERERIMKEEGLSDLSSSEKDGVGDIKEEEGLEESEEMVEEGKGVFVTVNDARAGTVKDLPPAITQILQKQMGEWDTSMKNDWSSSLPKSRTGKVNCVYHWCRKSTAVWPMKNPYWACGTCEKFGRLCVRLEKPGILTVLPKQPSSRVGGREDDGFWI